MTVYGIIPYPGAVSSVTKPDHLALCSWASKRFHSAIDGYRYLELGCGGGANILALACYRVHSTFIGVDGSLSEIATAREGSDCLQLKNVQFAVADIRDLDPAEFAPCDYVVAHGVYSWVPDDVREAILGFCRQALAPSGLAYISYNAQPGWATRRIVRETLLRARSVRDAPIEEKAHRAIEYAAQLLEDLPSRDYASAVLLAGELERVRNGNPGYVYHEYLAEVNDGFWLGEFVERARSHGLDYVCDAQFGRWEGYVPEQLRAALARRDLDPIEQEEIADLLGDRYFHASILCRADAPRGRSSREELWDQVHVATSLGAMSDQFDLADGVVERFSGTNGTEITLQAAITKAAVVSLCAQWPRGSTLQQIRERAVQLLQQYGFPIQTGFESQLLDDLTTLFEAGQIDLRLHEPEYEMSVPAHPAAHALARFEAGRRNALSTPFHLPIPLEPAAMALVRELDGRRSQAELSRDYGEPLTTETLTVLARWGLLL
jgi:SAM-dependent methyltransferase